MRISSCLLAASLLAIPTIAAAKPPVATRPAPKVSLHRRVFDTVWRTVGEGHYDPKMNGVNWNAVRLKYLPKAEAAKTDAAFYAVLNAMLGELKQSHLAAIAPEVMRAAEGVGIGTKSEGESGDSGMTVEWVEDQPIVVRVTPGGAAAEAGIKPGYIIASISGKPLKPILEKILAAHPHRYPGEERVEIWAGVNALLNGTVGTKLTITVKDETDAEKPITLTPKKPGGEMITFGALPPIPAEIETKTLAGGIGYIRFSIFLLPLSDPIKQAIRDFAAKDAPGIIIDLRGNRGGLGGMASGLAGTLIAKQSNLGTMRMRATTLRFPIFPQEPIYKGQVVVLTDEGSISTSEILAAGLQELGRAKVVGRQTAGMVLPSQIVTLPDGGRLQFVFADFRTPKGILLEGRGVQPDVPVTLTRAALLAAPDSDLLLDAALAQFKPKENTTTP